MNLDCLSERYLSHTMISDRDNVDHHRQSDIKLKKFYYTIEGNQHTFGIKCSHKIQINETLFQKLYLHLTKNIYKIYRELCPRRDYKHQRKSFFTSKGEYFFYDMNLECIILLAVE